MAHGTLTLTNGECAAAPNTASQREEKIKITINLLVYFLYLFI